jgi:hypothetical protein
MTVFVIGIVFFGNIPLIKKVFEKKEFLEIKKMKLGAGKDDVEKSQKYSQLLESFSGEKELIEKAIIKEDSIVSFIEELEKISSSVGSQIEISHVESSKKQQTVMIAGSEKVTQEKTPVKKEKTANSIAMKVVLTGNYNQFLQFYYKLENMPYVFSVDYFDIKSGVSRSTSAGYLEREQEEKKNFVTGEIAISFFAK